MLRLFFLYFLGHFNCYLMLRLLLNSWRFGILKSRVGFLGCHTRSLRGFPRLRFDCLREHLELVKLPCPIA